MSDDNVPVPKESKLDTAHALVKGALGSVPFVGGLVAEVFGIAIAPPIQRRNREFAEYVAQSLDELRKQHGITFEEMAENPKFINSVSQVAQAAIATSNDEKREALRNALLNSALPKAPDETRCHVFVRMIDELTAAHLKLLSILSDPEAAYQEQGPVAPGKSFGTMWDLIVHLHPELRGDDAFYDQLCVDLHNRGLTILHSLHDAGRAYHFDPSLPKHEQHGYARPLSVRPNSEIYVKSPRTIRPWASKLGDELLAFIRSPLQPVTVVPADGH